MIDTLLKKLVPDCPIYIIRSPEIEMVVDNVTLAFTESKLHFALQKDLEKLGLWGGPKPIIILNTPLITNMVQELWGDESNEKMSDYVAALTLHEMAHVLQNPLPYYAEKNETLFNADDFRTVLFNAASMPRVAPAESTIPPWHQHGRDFQRLALHLNFRAEKLLGRRLPVKYTTGSNYGLSHSNTYESALREECEKLFDLPVTRILSTPACENFLSVFRRDSSVWIDSIPEEKI